MSNANLILRRNYLDNCTMGKLYHEGKFICYTVEKPWKSNIPFESCIPAGIYDLREYNSPKHFNCFVMVNKNLGVGITEGIRTHCLIHIANFPDEVVGCIGPGLRLHPTTWGVAHSRLAMEELNGLIDFKRVDWTLTII